MNKNLNIRSLLTLLPKGTKLYCKCFNEYVDYIGYNDRFAVIQTCSENPLKYAINSFGDVIAGETAFLGNQIFPSEEQQNWNEFKKNDKQFWDLYRELANKEKGKEKEKESIKIYGLYEGD